MCRDPDCTSPVVTLFSALLNSEITGRRQTHHPGNSLQLLHHLHSHLHLIPLATADPLPKTAETYTEVLAYQNQPLTLQTSARYRSTTYISSMPGIKAH